jgi:hypothetical protein
MRRADGRAKMSRNESRLDLDGAIAHPDRVRWRERLRVARSQSRRVRIVGRSRARIRALLFAATVVQLEELQASLSKLPPRSGDLRDRLPVVGILAGLQQQVAFRRPAQIFPELLHVSPQVSTSIRSSLSSRSVSPHAFNRGRSSSPASGMRNGVFVGQVVGHP